MLLDGTLVPTGNRAGTGTRNYNTKHHEQALDIQVAAFRDGSLTAASIPVRGSRHDSRALEEVGRADQGIQARQAGPLIAGIADTAYIKHTPRTPRKKSRGGKRTKEDTDWNRRISSMRAPIDRSAY